MQTAAGDHWVLWSTIFRPLVQIRLITLSIRVKCFCQKWVGFDPIATGCVCWRPGVLQAVVRALYVTIGCDVIIDDVTIGCDVIMGDVTIGCDVIMGGVYIMTGG
jgi:hypothetical protein